MHRGNPAANPMPATAELIPTGSVVVPSDATAVGVGVDVATGALDGVDEPPVRGTTAEDATTGAWPQPAWRVAGEAMAALAA